MKKTNNNRRKLVTGRPNPMALEARIMFDAAAVDTAIAAKTTADATAAREITAASTRETVQENCAALPAAVTAALAAPREMFALEPADAALRPGAQQAAQAVRDYLANADDATLFALFNGNQNDQSEAWQHALDKLRQDFADGSFSIRVQTIGNAEIGGVFAAFAASGPDGDPVIFINQDWLDRGASQEAISRVLIEETGHAIDRILNGERDRKSVV